MNDSRTSLTLQIILHLNSWYSRILIVLETLLFLYKFLYLPYPVGNAVSEVLLLFLFIINEGVCLMSCNTGNLTGNLFYLTVSSLLHVPTITLLVYLLWWQTYVLKVEQYVFLVGLMLKAFELSASFVTMGKIMKKVT